MKLTPIIKLIGNLTVCLKIKSTFRLSELFCIPTISMKNKEALNVSVKNILLNNKTFLMDNKLYFNTYCK